MKSDAVFLAVVACVGVTAWGGETKRDATWVGKRIEAWQPTREERAFDEIGWARDLREAERLGKQHGRPVFLFTYDGTSLTDYRC